MAVYVDELRDYGVVIRGNGPVWCHMTADTLDELHEMADRLRLRRWFQDKSVPHYDLVPSKRREAVKQGAVEVEALAMARKRLAERAAQAAQAPAEEAAAPAATVGAVRYPVILIDPPWQYRHAGGRGAAENHYRTMKIVDLAKAIPVPDLAAEDAVLFMWGTFPTVDDNLALMKAWGFKFKTAAFVWEKVNRDGTPFIGTGSYTRANAEPCWLGVRGKRLLRLSRGVPQIIRARPRGHSRKPDEIYGRIQALYAGPYVELCARQPWPGWDTALSDQADLFTAQPPLFDLLGMDALWGSDDPDEEEWEELDGDSEVDRSAAGALAAVGTR